jgi:hypothetical protein
MERRPFDTRRGEDVATSSSSQMNPQSLYTPSATGVTNFDLLQRATRSEAEALRLQTVITALEVELRNAKIQQVAWKTTDPFYYVTPVSVLPPQIVNDHRHVIESIVEHAILYRESFKLLQPASTDPEKRGTNGATMENQRTSRMVRQLQQENELLRSTIARLHNEAASRF